MGLSCHPEQSEGSQPTENTRFFASLRMTNSKLWEFLNSLLAPGESQASANRWSASENKPKTENRKLKTVFKRGRNKDPTGRPAARPGSCCPPPGTPAPGGIPP